MHQGTLPREQALRDMVVAKEEGKDYNANDLNAGIKGAVNGLVDQQIRTGIDIVNDGEQSKSGFLLLHPHAHERARRAHRDGQPGRGAA